MGAMRDLIVHKELSAPLLDVDQDRPSRGPVKWTKSTLCTVVSVLMFTTGIVCLVLAYRIRTERTSYSAMYEYDVNSLDLTRKRPFIEGGWTKDRLGTQTPAPIAPTPQPSISEADAIENARILAETPAVKKFTHHQVRNFDRKNLSWESIWSGDPTCRFNLYGNDVIVFLHIQKTGGTTVERALTRFLNISRPCQCLETKKRCRCFRPFITSDHMDFGNFPETPHDPLIGPKKQWLFSRMSTGWSCGLHADWTELVTTDCVDNVLDRLDRRKIKRRYFFMTFLRDPVSRFISEYRHVRRGATWPSAHICNGRPPTPEELPQCFDPDLGWNGVTLNGFLDCPYNMAFNRQTRMLADLTLVHCYNSTSMPAEERDALLLASAKRNLRSMAYFGLLERMDESQVLFELTFRLQFTKPFTPDGGLRSKSNNTEVTAKQLQRIHQLNFFRCCSSSLSAYNSQSLLHLMVG